MHILSNGFGIGLILLGLLIALVSIYYMMFTNAIVYVKDRYIEEQQKTIDKCVIANLQLFVGLSKLMEILEIVSSDDPWTEKDTERVVKEMEKEKNRLLGLTEPEDLYLNLQTRVVKEALKKKGEEVGQEDKSGGEVKKESSGLSDKENKEATSIPEMEGEDSGERCGELPRCSKRDSSPSSD